MNKHQNNTYYNDFYYHLDLQLEPKNKLVIDTSYTEPCMVPSLLDYFQIPSHSSDGNLFHCPAPLFPTSASVESLLSLSLGTPSPASAGPLLLPSPDGSFCSLPSPAQDDKLHLDPPLPPCIDFPLQLYLPPVYDSYSSKRPNDHTSEVLKTKHIGARKESIQRNFNKMLKPFVCKTCSRPFARKHDLQRHIRVHTGVKPYSCLNCKRAFVRTDALKHHLRSVEACRTSPIIQAMKESNDRRYRNL